MYTLTVGDCAGPVATAESQDFAELLVKAEELGRRCCSPWHYSCVGQSSDATGEGDSGLTFEEWDELASAFGRGQAQGWRAA